MKKIYGLILFFSINLTPNFVQAQILKKIVNGVKEGAANLKEGIDDAIEFSKFKDIFKEINKNEFSKAEAQLLKFKEQYPENIFSNYLKYQISENENSGYKNFDTAFNELRLFRLKYNKLKDADLKEKYCKETKICTENIEENFLSIQKKVYEKYKSSESLLTDFLFKYNRQTIFHDSAIALRHVYRYQDAERLNTIEAYSNFISNNADAKQVNAAIKNRTILAYKKVEIENTIESYTSFLSNYREYEFLTKKATLHIKYLKFQEISDLYKKILAENAQILDDLRYNRISSYSSNYTQSNEKIVNASIEYGGKKIEAEKLFNELEKRISQFKSRYTNGYELKLLSQIEDDIRDTKEKIYFRIIQLRGDDITGFSRFIRTYPNSIYSVYFDNKKSNLERIKMREDELASQKRERELMEQSLAEEKRKKEQEEENNIILQAAKKLSEADRKYFVRVLENEIDTDPKGIVGSSCGTAYGQCKWCARSVSYRKEYSSRVQALKNMVMMAPLANAMLIAAGGMYSYAEAMSSVFTGAKAKKFPSKDQMVTSLANDLRVELQKIRSGNYYSCEGSSGDLFCSERCQYEYKIRRRN